KRGGRPAAREPSQGGLVDCHRASTAGCNEFAIHFCDFLSRHRNRARIGTTSVRLGCSLQGTDMLPVQCKAARVALGIGERELAAKAGVSPDTVSRLEKGE